MKKLFFATLFIAPTALCASWSQTQLHLNRGSFTNPFTDKTAATTVATLQHNSTHQLGDNFFFIDFIKDNRIDGYQDNDYYGEFYSAISFSKASGRSMKWGAIKDVGAVMGINAAGDSNVVKYLPGIKLYWDVPGFSFFNTLITGYIDDNQGIRAGSAPKETNSWMLDTAWGLPFTVGNQTFNFTGHIEYIASRQNELGNDVNNWILAQSIVQWDVGNTLQFEKNTLLLGIKWQVWHNKLGTETFESAPQLHVAWTF